MTISIQIEFETFGEPFTEEEKQLAIQGGILTHIDTQLKQGITEGQLGANVKRDDHILSLHANWKATITL